MLLTPGLRKLALAAHLTASVGWIGAVAAFLALAVVGVGSADDHTVRSAYCALDLLVRFAIVPLSLLALLSGLGSALGTRWGLFRHYWVLIKLALTLVAIAVLLVQVEPIRVLALAAADLLEPQRPLIHAAGGLVVLVVVQLLGVFKPPGLTRYGWKKEHAHAHAPRPQ